MTKEEFEFQTKCLAAIMKAANEQLLSEKNKIAHKYANDRGLPDNLIKTFNLGFIPKIFVSDPCETFCFKAIKKEFPDVSNERILAVLKTNNLLKSVTTKSDEIKFLDTFANRLLFPFYDKNNHLVGITGRNIAALNTNKDYEPPKYYNTPESDVFHKREIFFNYNNVKNKYKSTEPLVIAEGVMDVSAFEKSGICAVAGSGIALSETQVELIKALKPSEVVLSYDNDMAGMDAMFRNYEILQQAGLNVKFINYKTMPLKDMDEIVNSPKFGPKTVQQLVSSADNELDFLFRYFTYKKTQHEEKNKTNNSKIISFKKVEDLTDKEKYEILLETFTAYAKNHEKEKNSFVIPLKNYDALINKLKHVENISYDDAKELLHYFRALNTQKVIRKIKYIKSKNNKQLKPEWEAFENEDAIHTVLQLLGAESGRRGFYKSLWNNDSNPSLSVKRGQNLWKDFSSGYGGGIYQLVGYIDISDPENPKITDNPNQTSHIQAYNWLIKVLNSTLKPTTQQDSVENYTFDPTQREKIQLIQKLFKNMEVLPFDFAVDQLKSFEKKIKELWPEYSNIECPDDNPTLVLPVKHSQCMYPVYDITLVDLNKKEGKVTVNPKAKYYPFFQSTKSNQCLDILFEYKINPFLDPKNNLENSQFLLPKEISSKNLKDILTNNYKIINICKPSNEFIKQNFKILAECKKPIFINNEDLYVYCAKNNILAGTDLVQSLAKNNPSNIFKNKLFEALYKQDPKKHPNYWKKIFTSSLDKPYPPVH